MYNAEIWQNLVEVYVFGGVISAGVDVVDGAAYDYPTDIYIPMKKGIA